MPLNGFDFTLIAAKLTALGTSTLNWPDQNLICVPDLQLGKFERYLHWAGLHCPLSLAPVEIDQITQLARSHRWL